MAPCRDGSCGADARIDRMVDTSILVAATSLAGALAAGFTALSRPRLCFGMLFLLASFSRATLETPLGTMRPEMPAIALVAAVLLADGRLATLRTVPRSTLAIAIAFGTYLGALALSSALIAPGTAQSLRMVAWVAISMVGGIVAFVLIRPRPTDAIEPLAFAGAAMGALGIVVAGLFFVAGPTFSLGIQDPGTLLPRVYALGWEANLYASFLGMSAFFALEAARGPRRAAGLVMLALILIGFPLGVTRGAYAGLAVGILAYAAVHVAHGRHMTDLPRLGAHAGALLGAGIVASIVLLPNVIARPGGNGTTGASPAPGSSVLATQPPSAEPSGASPAPTATPTPAPTPYPDTLAFRLERVPIALDDLRSSPLIGFGAESFGQRHPDRYAGSGPDHIAIMAVVVPYEAGLIGATALAIGFVLLLLALWKSAGRSMREGNWQSAGAAAAFVGSLASILVAYQLNNALQFAINWIVIGAATALTIREKPADSAVPDG